MDRRLETKGPEVGVLMLRSYWPALVVTVTRIHPPILRRLPSNNSHTPLSRRNARTLHPPASAMSYVAYSDQQGIATALVADAVSADTDAKLIAEHKFDIVINKSV
jgi:hypothetical protein